LDVDFGAVADGAPAQRQLVVVLAHFRTDVGDELAGVDAGVDAVQRAADLIGLPVVECPESAIGATIVRGETPVQVDDAKASGAQEWAANQGSTEHRD